MRLRRTLLTGSAVLAALTVLSAGPALADPPPKVTPAPGSVVSVGAQATQNLSDALSAVWDKKFPKRTKIYTWDALSPRGVDNNIATKKGCAKILRPNGSSPGIADLAANAGGKTRGHPCIDFARSSRGRKTTDPTNIAFVAQALDNVTYARLAKGSNAPGNLTTADLNKVYTCVVTNWDKFPGGKNARIKPLLAQAGAGTVTFFLNAIGVTTPGPCVNEPATLEENEGVNKIFRNNKDAIIPFDAADWIAQAYHSAKCLHSSCTANKAGVTCRPNTKKGQNAFGCDENGVLGLGKINGTSPTTGRGAKTVLNPKFTIAFVRTLYAVVRGSAIPAYLRQFLGPEGWYCTNPKLVRAYGFETDRACGTI
jgi:ABC-type phosphate transport system substrate-binding protein